MLTRQPRVDNPLPADGRGLAGPVVAESQFCYSRCVSWSVLYHPEAETELNALPVNEQVAIGHAAEKLEALGPNLGYPHSSAVKTAYNLRELRPRGGRSRWRAFYGQVGTAFVIGSIGPEASVNQRKFNRAVTVAEQRIKDLGDE